MRIYGDIASGNCLKVKYTADHLRLPYEWVAVDVDARRKPYAGFPRPKRPWGKCPSSNSTTGACWRSRTPSSAISRAAAPCCRTMPSCRRRSTNGCSGSRTATSSSSRAAGSRWSISASPGKSASPGASPGARPRSISWIGRWTGASFFVGDGVTVADIALLAYTRLAGEGGFDLSTRANVIAWIGRCEKALGLQPVETAH